MSMFMVGPAHPGRGGERAPRAGAGRRPVGPARRRWRPCWSWRRRMSVVVGAAGRRSACWRIGPAGRRLVAARGGVHRARPGLRRRHRGGRPGHREHPGRVYGLGGRGAGRVVRAAGRRRHRRRHAVVALADRLGAEGPARTPASAGGRSLLALARSPLVAGRLPWLLAPRRDLGAGLVAAPPRSADGRAARSATRSAWRCGCSAAARPGVGRRACSLTGIAYGSVGRRHRRLRRRQRGDARTSSPSAGAPASPTRTSSPSLLILALIAGGYAIVAALRLRSEETAGRAEPVLATARVAVPLGRPAT